MALIVWLGSVVSSAAAGVRLEANFACDSGDFGSGVKNT